MMLADLEGPLRNLFKEHGVWYDWTHQYTRELWRHMCQQIDRDQAHYLVAFDPAGGGKVVGHISYQKEWSLRYNGTIHITITELLVAGEYRESTARQVMLDAAVRAAIGCKASTIRVAPEAQDVEFFGGENLFKPVQTPFMERELPWDRFAKLREPIYLRQRKLSPSDKRCAPKRKATKDE